MKDHEFDNVSKQATRKGAPTFWRINEFEVDDDKSFISHQAEKSLLTTEEIKEPPKTLLFLDG
jgi:hypothetical protein